MTTIPLCPVYLECVLSLRRPLLFSNPSTYALRRGLIIIANIIQNLMLRMQLRSHACSTLKLIVQII